jgi:hypothetical protein
MSVFDRLFGGNPSPAPEAAPKEPQLTDDQALERYRYLLRTAPPEAIEQAHAEAFAQLTPDQRTRVLKELSQQLPATERAGAPTQADPQSLARLATRAELRQPGILERTFGGGGLGGMGGMFAGSLLGSIAGTIIGSAIAHQFLGGFSGGSESTHHEMDSARAEAASNDDSDSDSNDADSDDSDSDFSDSGGDDGGDFGGGDFGDV